MRHSGLARSQSIGIPKLLRAGTGEAPHRGEDRAAAHIGRGSSVHESSRGGPLRSEVILSTSFSVERAKKLPQELRSDAHAHLSVVHEHTAADRPRRRGPCSALPSRLTQALECPGSSDTSRSVTPLVWAWAPTPT